MAGTGEGVYGKVSRFVDDCGPQLCGMLGANIALDTKGYRDIRIGRVFALPTGETEIRFLGIYGTDGEFLHHSTWAWRERDGRATKLLKSGAVEVSYSDTGIRDCLRDGFLFLSDGETASVCLALYDEWEARRSIESETKTRTA